MFRYEHGHRYGNRRCDCNFWNLFFFFLKRTEVRFFNICRKEENPTIIFFSIARWSLILRVTYLICLVCHGCFNGSFDKGFTGYKGGTSGMEGQPLQRQNNTFLNYYFWNGNTFPKLQSHMERKVRQGNKRQESCICNIKLDIADSASVSKHFLGICAVDIKRYQQSILALITFYSPFPSFVPSLFLQ